VASSILLGKREIRKLITWLLEQPGLNSAVTLSEEILANITLGTNGGGILHLP